MSDDKDPQRISEAADNCEVLRARLAKYEDADGNPLAALKQPSAGVDADRELITKTIGFEFAPGELQTVNEHDLLRLVEQARAQLAAPAGVVLPDPDFTLDSGSTPCYYAETVKRLLAAAPSPAPAIYQCPRCATSMQVDRTAKPAPASDVVPVPRGLLEEIVELHRRRGVVLIIHVEQLADLLNGGLV